MSETPKPLFVVSDEYELLALWRLVAEAKFHPDPYDTDLWGSPYVHSLSKRIDDALLECAQIKGMEQTQRHLSWRASLESNVVLPVVKKKLKGDAVSVEWKSWTMDERITYVRACVAPFEVSSDLAQRLIREAET
jgi:hypothetical protein